LVFVDGEYKYLSFNELIENAEKLCVLVYPDTGETMFIHRVSRTLDRPDTPCEYYLNIFREELKKFDKIILLDEWLIEILMSMGISVPKK
jgi:hypothetical protein